MVVPSGFCPPLFSHGKTQPATNHRNMKQTSLMAYEEVRTDLGRRQAEVLRAVRVLKAATDKDITQYLGWPINCTTPRRLELERMGKVREVGERVQDGRRATVWTTF